MGSSPRDRTWPPVPEPLPYPVVDNHTHLDMATAPDGPEGDGPRLSLDEHLARAAAVGVPRMVQVGCDLPSIATAAAMARDTPALLAAIAIHPNEAPLHAGVREVAPDGLEPDPRPHHAVPLDEAIAQVASLAAAEPRVRAIGETGLDHFRTAEAGRRAQRESFRAHIALAKELGLALQIHDRDAHRDVVETLLADGAPDRTVFHCFSGDAELAAVCAEQGWYLSFAGTVTFRSAEHLREALRVVPLDRVMVETDAPFLTPHPHRGRPNAPYLVPLTMRTIAEVRGVDLEEACRAVAATSEGVYGPWNAPTAA